MWNLETYLFTVTKDVRVPGTIKPIRRMKWSCVAACNEVEAKYKTLRWLREEPEWKGWVLDEDSIEVNDEKWAHRNEIPGYECGEFFKEKKSGVIAK